METLTGIKYPESQWRRTFVFTYNDGGWVVGEQEGYYVVNLDRGGVVLAGADELAY